jgi:pimeloyl-ACP methyl ester carboxylesterase
MATSPAVALLLPGMSLNATIFPDLGLSSLTTDFSRFTPDEPGMGPYVEQVATLTASAPWQEAHYRVAVAHSFGGMLALSWLLAHPDAQRRLHGLVLIGTTAGPMFDAVRLRIAGWRSRSWRVRVGPLLPLWDSPRVTHGLHRLLNRRTLEPRPVDFRALPYHDDIRVGLAGWHATDWRARRAFRRAMRGFDVRDRLGEIAVPTVVLHGERDCYFTAASALEMADRLPRAELRIVAGAGHVLPLTHGDAVCGAVRDLLRDAGYSAPSAPASSV